MVEYNKGHELALLGAYRSEPALLDELVMSADDFSQDTRAAYVAMRAIHETGNDSSDLRLLADQGVPVGVLAKIDIGIAANAEYYIREIRELTLRRMLRQIGLKLTDNLKGTESASDIMGELERQIVDLASGTGRDIVHIREMINPAIEEIEKKHGSHGALPGLSCGFPGIDSKLQGFMGGNLYIIAARPSIGKTALALSMAHKMGIAGAKVGFFSLEMSRRELGTRLLSMHASLNLRSVQNGNMAPRAFADLNNAATAFYAAEMWFDDTPNMLLADIRSSARQMRRRGAEVLFVDYMGLVTHGTTGMGMYERVGAIAKSLKGLARELDVPVVALSQLNRQAEGAEPSMMHMAESDQVNQHADVIMLLHRDSRDSAEAKLIIDKARNAETGVVLMTFLGAYVRYEEGVR